MEQWTEAKQRAFERKVEAEAAQKTCSACGSALMVVYTGNPMRPYYFQCMQYEEDSHGA